MIKEDITLINPSGLRIRGCPLTLIRLESLNFYTNRQDNKDQRLQDGSVSVREQMEEEDSENEQNEQLLQHLF